MIDEDIPTTGPAPRFDVFRSIAYHEASFQIEVVLAGSVQQHARVRLSPRAGVIKVETNVDLSNLRQLFQQAPIDGLHELAGNSSSTDVGLIAGSDEDKPGVR